MPSYALLGATGNIGQALLTVLLQSSDHQINAHCRSKQKLVRLKPEVSDKKQVTIFESNLEDTEVLANCLKGTSAAFLAVAQSGNQPGTTVAHDLAHNVVAALERLKTQNVRLPKLIVISSASVDHRLMASVPAFLRNTLYLAMGHVYEDLKAGERLLRSRDDLVSATWVRPGALTHDAQRGHTLSLDKAKSPVSFLDLAAGMVEIAEDATGRYDMKGVAVNATSKDVTFPRQAPLALLLGLMFWFFPWTYRFLG